MKRLIPFALMVSLGAYAYACKSSSSDDENNPGGGDPGGENPGGGGTPGADAPKEEWAKINPIEGIAPATAILETNAFSDGPVWHAGLGVLFFSTPLGEGALYRMLPDGRVLKVRDGVLAQGTQPIGNSVAPNGDVVTVEAKRVVRMAVGEAGVGDPQVVATSFGGGTPVPDPDGGAPIAGGFDTLNDVAVGKDGTMYVTDPGYFATPIANRIYRIAPDGTVSVVEAFSDVPRPNGIALDRDSTHLYVGFTTPVQGTNPFVRNYLVNADGTLGEWTKFIDLDGPDSMPDGIAVDLANNVYVAVKGGIAVYKEDGSKIGDIPLEEKPTGMTFGGADGKKLYITTEGVKLWEVTLKVPGLAQ